MADNSQSGILSLPNETILQIMENLDAKNDIPALRLMCKRLALLGGEPLFKELRVSSLPESVENLVRISKDTILRAYVKKILYDTVTLVRNLSRKTWEDHYIQPPNGVGRPRQIPQIIHLGDSKSAAEMQVIRAGYRKWLDRWFTKAQKTAAFSAYGDLLANIEAYQVSDRYFMLLGEGLSALPALQEIRVDTRCSKIHKERAEAAREMSIQIETHKPPRYINKGINNIERKSFGNLTTYLPISSLHGQEDHHFLSKQHWFLQHSAALGNIDVGKLVFETDILSTAFEDTTVALLPPLLPPSIMKLEFLELKSGMIILDAGGDHNSHLEGQFSRLLKQARELRVLSRTCWGVCTRLVP